MEYNEENLEAILSNVTEFNDIKLSDIPDIDLYMDQVTTLFDMKLESLKRDKNDKIMTKTMVNNYAKGKFFPTVKGKKYNKRADNLIRNNLQSQTKFISFRYRNSTYTNYGEYT